MGRIDWKWCVNRGYREQDHPNRSIQGGKTIRRIPDSDVNVQRTVSSEVLSVSMGAEQQGSASNRSVRVRKTVQTAEIFQCPGLYTTTILEPVDVNDLDKVKMVSVYVRTRWNYLTISCR